jgi:hypothetical protein
LVLILVVDGELLEDPVDAGLPNAEQLGRDLVQVANVLEAQPGKVRVLDHCPAVALARDLASSEHLTAWHVFVLGNAQATCPIECLVRVQTARLLLVCVHLCELLVVGTDETRIN